MNEMKISLKSLNISQRKLVILCLISVVLGYICFNLSPIYVTVIVGDSMEPEINHHDILVFSTVSEPSVGDTVDVSNPNDPYKYDIVHEVKKINKTHVQTRGVNNNFDDPPTRQDNINGKLLFSVTPPNYIHDLYRGLVPSTYNELSKQYS